MLLFFQETTPDTSGYMIAGYAVAFIVMGLYVFSLYLRDRNLRQDLSILEELDKPAPPPPAKAATPKTKVGQQPKPVTKRARK